MARKKADSKDDLKAKKKTWDTICKFPGLFPHELEKIVRLKPEVLAGFLQGFEDAYLVEVRHEDGKKQYFPITSMGLEDQAILSMLKDDLIRALLDTLIDSPHQTLAAIEKRLKIPKSKLQPSIERLFKLGVIALAKDSHKGNQTTFQVFDPERIRKLLEVKDTSLFT